MYIWLKFLMVYIVNVDEFGFAQPSRAAILLDVFIPPQGFALGYYPPARSPRAYVSVIPFGGGRARGERAWGK